MTFKDQHANERGLFRMPYDFYQRKEVKVLRKMENGATLLIVYTKLLIDCYEEGGALFLGDSIENVSHALSKRIGEPEEYVTTVLEFLQDKNLLEIVGSDAYYFNAMGELKKEGD